MEEKLYFTNGDGLKLCGILTKPKKETRKCVILCHGLTVDKEEEGSFSVLSKKLVDSGFVVFRFDFRGHGESEGTFHDITVTGEEDDLQHAVFYLQNLGYKKFGILGASFAAGGVSLFAAKNHNIVKAIVFWYPLIDYQSFLSSELSWPKKYFGKDQMETLEKDGFMEIGAEKFKVGKPLIKEMNEIYPWRELVKTKIPVLFIHCRDDNYVPSSDSLKYSKMLKESEIKIMHSDEHGFTEDKNLQAQANKETTQFFSKVFNSEI